MNDKYIKVWTLLLKFTILSSLFSFYSSRIFAQQELSDSVISKRLVYVENTIKRNKVKTDRWWYGWLAAYGAGAIGQGIVTIGSDDLRTRQDMLLGVATCVLGDAGQFISPLIPEKKSLQLNNLPEDSPEDRMKKLAFAEELLQEYANKEKLARNWTNHAITGVVNLGAGAVTWIGYKRTFGEGVECFALNTVITELQIWTTPRFAKRRYESYIRDNIQIGHNMSYLTRINYYFAVQPNGFSFKLLF